MTMLATYATYVGRVVIDCHPLAQFQQTLIMKKDLSASAVFSSMSVFDMLRDQLHIVFWTIPRTVQGLFSMLTTTLERYLHVRFEAKSLWTESTTSLSTYVSPFCILFDGVIDDFLRQSYWIPLLTKQMMRPLNILPRIVRLIPMKLVSATLSSRGLTRTMDQ